jgi:hypothetical protein
MKLRRSMLRHLMDSLDHFASHVFFIRDSKDQVGFRDYPSAWACVAGIRTDVLGKFSRPFGTRHNMSSWLVFFRNCCDGQRLLVRTRAFAHGGKALEKHRFRPMYAPRQAGAGGANMEHPSRTINRGYGRTKCAGFVALRKARRNAASQVSSVFVSQ